MTHQAVSGGKMKGGRAKLLGKVAIVAGVFVGIRLGCGAANTQRKIVKLKRIFDEDYRLFIPEVKKFIQIIKFHIQSNIIIDIFTNYHNLKPRLFFLIVIHLITSAYSCANSEDEHSRMWNKLALPPIYSELLGRVLLDGLNRADLLLQQPNHFHTITKFEFTSEFGEFCMLPPEVRMSLTVWPYTRYTPEASEHLSQVFEKCGMIIFKRNGHLPSATYFAYFAAGLDAKTIPIHIQLKSADLWIIQIPYQPDDPMFETRAESDARTRIDR